MRRAARELPVLLFAGWLVILWVVAGVLVLVALAATRRTTLDRLYERLDLNGRDGKPANSKVLFTFGVLAGWVVIAGWGTALVLMRQSLGTPFITLVALVLCASAGTDVLKAALKARLGGLSGALREQERQRPAAIRASAEISQRRLLGADDDTEPV